MCISVRVMYKFWIASDAVQCYPLALGLMLNFRLFVLLLISFLKLSQKATNFNNLVHGILGKFEMRSL